MPIKVKIIKDGYGHSIGQVLELNEFDAGHLMGFKFAVPYVEPVVETRPAVQPEVRIFVPPVPVVKPDEQIVVAAKEPDKAVGFFGKRGRRKNK